MGGRFAGMAVVKAEDGSAIDDPWVDAQARCLMLLVSVQRYLRALHPLVNRRGGEDDIASQTHLLAMNLVTIAGADYRQLDYDIQALAAHLHITIQGIETDSSKAVN